MTDHNAAPDRQLVAWVADAAHPTGRLAGDRYSGTTDATVERHFPAVPAVDDLVVDWQLPQLAD
jgi:hypothetical protein